MEQQQTGQLAEMIRANPAMRRGHLRRRCELCQQAWDCPEAFEWLEEQLVEQTLTQQEIANELRRRWAIDVTQAQVSRHKTRHFDPMLVELRERVMGHQAAAQVFGDVSPEELARIEAQLAIMDARERLEDCENDELAAKLHASIARLAAMLDRAAMTPLEMERLDAAVREKAAQAQQEEDRVKQLVVEFARQYAPDLVKRLAAVDVERGEG